MNLRGPELKMPEVKVPPFLADLYYDLRDRRLLPLIGLVVVAIVAVPFLLSNSPEQVAPVTSEGGSASGSAAGSSELAVVEATPGLRDPKKRLKGQTATDPFLQKFAGGGSSSESEEGEESEGSSSEGSSFSSTPSESSEPVRVEVENESGETATVERPGAGNGAPGSSGPVSPDSTTRYFGFRPNVRFGQAGSENLKNYPELAVGTRLPQKKPVAVFLGVSDDGKRATFALTPEVILVQGEGQCIGGAQSCTLLTLKTGDAVSLVTGSPDRTFRLNVTNIQWVEVDPPKPQKASSSSRKPFLDIAQSFSK